MVMEAGGTTPAPEPAPFDAGADAGASPFDAGPPPDIGEPPPLDLGDDGMGGDMSDLGMGDGTGDDGMGDGSGDQDQQEEGTQNGGEKLSEKANSILNQRLYQQMMDRNQEIEDIMESINRIVPLLSYETIKANDQNMNRLKNAHEKGKSYLIEKFIDAKYGENLIFYQKLDALYTLLLEQINNNLKKVKNSNEMN